VQDQPLLLNLSQAATLLGLTKPQLYELCRSRSRLRQTLPLPCVKLGKRLAFRRESLERWIEQLESTAVRAVEGTGD
jgi:predicted DNA-binding transcriptional regulator AlpA